MRGLNVKTLDRRRLRWIVALFFFAFAIPTALLVRQAYTRLQWEGFRQYQLSAEEFTRRIDQALAELVREEEARSFSDYSFLVVAGDPAANFLQRSALSAYPVATGVPGIVGYFEVAPDGAFSTPLLPPSGVDAAAYGIGVAEREARLALENEIRGVLAANRLVRTRPVTIAPRAVTPSAADAKQRERAVSPAVAAEAVPAVAQRTPSSVGETQTTLEAAVPAASVDLEVPAGAAAFDQLKQGTFAFEAQRARAPAENRAPAPATRTPQATLSDRDQSAASARQKRTEETALAEPAPPDGVSAGADADGAGAPLRVRTFASELDPFELSLLETGQWVLFRQAWREGQRFIQGLLLEQGTLLEQLMGAAFNGASLSATSELSVRYQERTLAHWGSALGAPRIGLYQARLSPPFADFELIYDVGGLPFAPGQELVVWGGVVMASVLIAGFLLMYRLGLEQIKLAQRQQDFVSAVSHELKTPLTSIRMYGEMLRAGWADEKKKQTYYDYIHEESERLSRLIDNVLQLARMTRNETKLDLKAITVAELIDIVRSKVSTQVERAGFALEVSIEREAGAAQVCVDTDCFIQVVINLVDNALKFSAQADRRIVEMACRVRRDGHVVFLVRDFGPGIPRGAMKKIFDLSYRPETPLTRATPGTGIGLALVRELSRAMGGSIAVRNRDPGAEFELSLPQAIP
jgi:signal transduction histidine kinase